MRASNHKSFSRIKPNRQTDAGWLAAVGSKEALVQTAASLEGAYSGLKVRLREAADQENLCTETYTLEGIVGTQSLKAAMAIFIVAWSRRHSACTGSVYLCRSPPLTHYKLQDCWSVQSETTLATLSHLYDSHFSDLTDRNFYQDPVYSLFK